jgi:Ser/Thr protein kinase RdoA (MazF antagonist)
LTAQILSGGQNTIVIKDDSVHRPPHPWSATTRKIIELCKEHNLSFIPEWRGTDTDGTEIFEYIDGTVGHDPCEPTFLNKEAVQSAARALRQFHDACSDLLFRDDLNWQSEPIEPRQVVCHGDFAPYNCVFSDSAVVGVFDFDAARIGPRSWDLSYALYRFAPFVDMAHQDDGFGPMENRLHRANLFINSYDGDKQDLRDAMSLIPHRLHAMIDWMKKEAAAGNPNTIKNLKDGHHLLYEADAQAIAALQI